MEETKEGKRGGAEGRTVRRKEGTPLERHVREEQLQLA